MAKVNEYPPAPPCREINPCCGVSTLSDLYKFQQRTITRLNFKEMLTKHNVHFDCHIPPQT